MSANTGFGYRSSKFRWYYRFGWITLSHTPSDRNQNGKEPHPVVQWGRSLRAATSEQQARLSKSCEEIRADFPVAIFFLSPTFFSKFRRSWHMVVWQGLVLWCFFERSCALGHLIPTFGGLRMEAIWSYLLGTAAVARWCQHLNQQTPTFKKEDKSIHNFPDSQRPAGSSPQVPESYTSTWRDLQTSFVACF